MNDPRSNRRRQTRSAAEPTFHRYPWRYVAITFAITWSFWFSGALLGLEFTDPPMLALFVLGGSGPPLAALLLAYRERGSAGLRDIWRRLVDVRRVNQTWYLLIAAAVLLPHLGMVLFDWLVWGGGGGLASAGRFVITPVALFGALAYMLIAVIPEEIGWRGYGLDPLLHRYSALGASLILGTFWMIWHLPLYFVPGTFLHDTVGLGTARYWTINLAIPLIAVLHTWIYNNTARSIYSAVLFHILWNLAGEAFDPSARADLIRLVLLALLTAGVLLYWGHQHMTRERAAQAREHTVPGSRVSQAGEDQAPPSRSIACNSSTIMRSSTARACMRTIGSP